MPALDHSFEKFHLTLVDNTLTFYPKMILDLLAKQLATSTSSHGEEAVSVPYGIFKDLGPLPEIVHPEGADLIYPPIRSKKDLFSHKCV